MCVSVTARSHEPAPQRISENRQQGLIAGTTECKAGFHGGAFTHHAIRQHVQAQAYPGHGVAQDHTQQGQRIARMIPMGSGAGPEVTY